MIRSPFILRKTHDQRISAAVLRLEAAHEEDIRLLKSVHDAQRQHDLREAAESVAYQVMRERARCLQVAERTTPSARGSWVRSSIIGGIQDARVPTYTHQEPNQTT